MIAVNSNFRYQSVIINYYVYLICYSESAAAAGAAVNYGRDRKLHRAGYAHRARRPSKFQFDELFADSEGGTGEEMTSEGAKSSISE